MEDANQWMLNNAARCRMPLLPNNILISDSGFENVNAFNTVTTHWHQTEAQSRRGKTIAWTQAAQLCQNMNMDTRHIQVSKVKGMKLEAFVL